MSFGKLDSNIINSSLMNERLHVRWVFIMFISQKDDTGFISGTRKTMARNFNISIDDFDDAIKVLSSPDPESRTKDFDGKRIDVVDGGWILLNHEKYRANEQVKIEKRREYMKEYMRNKRKNDDSVNSVNVNKVNSKLTPVNSGLTSVSVSNSLSPSLSRSKNNSTNLDTSNTEKKITKSQVEEIYKEYPRKVGKGAALKSIEKALKKVSHGKLIDLVKKYSTSVKNLDVQFIPHPATWFNQERWDDPIEEHKPPLNKRIKNEYQEDRSHELPIYSIGSDGECKLTYGVGNE